MAYPPAPPLLLTRRLSSFLHTSLESLQEPKDGQPTAASTAVTTLHSALIVTPSGKLLAYKSPLPVRTLRTHCSVAASLWAIHASSSPSVAVALDQTSPRPPPSQKSHASPQAPSASQPHQDGNDDDDDNETYHDGSAPISIAASFNGGAVFVVRQLRCGLLFACSTPAPHSTASRPSTAGDPSAKTPLPRDASVSAPTSLLPYTTLPILSAAAPPAPAPAASSTSPASSTASPTTIPVTSSKPSRDAAGSLAPNGSVLTTATAETYETARGGEEEGEAASDGAGHDANDAASTTTTGTAGTTATIGGAVGKSGSVAATLAVARRQADELARLLDEKLGSLVVPEENIGINGFC